MPSLPVSPSVQRLRQQRINTAPTQHGQSPKSLSSKKPRKHGRSRSRERSGNASRPGDKPSPNKPPQHQDGRHGATGEALSDTPMGDGQSKALALALSKLNVSYHSTQALWEPEGYTPYAYIGSWELDTGAEEPIDDTNLSLSHCPPDETGSHHKPSHHGSLWLASDSTVVDYRSNAPTYTDVWHLIDTTQAQVSSGELDVEVQISDTGAIGSASPEWAQ